jgi:hypothetical protein
MTGIVGNSIQHVSLMNSLYSTTIFKLPYHTNAIPHELDHDIRQYPVGNSVTAVIRLCFQGPNIDSLYINTVLFGDVHG